MDRTLQPSATEEAASPSEPPAMFQSANQQRRSFKYLIVGAAALVLLLIAGGIAAKYLPSEIKFRNMRNASFYDYDFESFVEQYPTSHRMNDVDDLLWKRINDNPDDTQPWRLYQRLFAHGRHFGELEKRLAARKQTQLASLRSKPAFDLGTQFLAWFPQSAEVPEVREIMLTCLGATGAKTKNSPPIPVLRRLIQAAHNAEITYSVEGDESVTEVVGRLNQVFEPFGLTVTKSDPALIRIRQVQTEDNERPMIFDEVTKFPSIVIRVDLSIQLPGQTQPVWSGSVVTSTPERVEFHGRFNDEDGKRAAVLTGTKNELDDALQGMFRYQWPEASLNYWREFRKFEQWLRQSKRSDTEVLAHLNQLPKDTISDPTLVKLHAAYTDSYEYLKSLDDEPNDSTKGVSLEPLRKAAEFGARIERRRAEAQAKFEPFE